MGSGKTNMGMKLSRKLRMEFSDLDAEIEHRSGMTIKEIIKTYGEEHFRKIEAETLKAIDIAHKVISTGGGAPCYHDNVQWMKEKGRVVFLNVNEGVILSRLLKSDLTDRPLLQGLDEEGLKLFIHDKLKQRLPYYEQADIVIDGVSKSLERLVAVLTKN
jgi:shikimate kinase